MIEDNIQALRNAARINSNSPDSPEDNSGNSCCVMAGNDELIDDIAYDAISSKDKVKILFREHVILESERINKIFDFIMLSGTYFAVNQLVNSCRDKGGACLEIPHKTINEESNLMVLVAPEDMIKKFVSKVETQGIYFGILSDNKTSSFIETNLNTRVKMPRFLKDVFSPLFNMSDVVLSTVLITVDKEEDIEKIQNFAKSNKIFIINFKDIDMED